MRTVLSAVVALAAVILCFVAVPALWLDRNVVSEEGLLALAGPLSADEQFQTSVADAAADAALEAADVPANLLPLVRPLVAGAAQSLTSHPEYQQAWTETIRRSHQLTFEDESPTAAGAVHSGALRLDIAPLVSILASSAGDIVGADIAGPAQVLINLGDSDQRQNVVLLERLSRLGAGIAAAAAAAFVLALVIARRRSTTVALVGGGVLIAAGLWKVGTDFVGERLLSSGQDNTLAVLVRQHLVEVGSESFFTWILAGAGAGAVLVLVGAVGRIFAGSQT